MLEHLHGGKCLDMKVSEHLIRAPPAKLSYLIKLYSQAEEDHGTGWA